MRMSVQLTLSMDRDFFDALERAARERYMSPQQFLLDCARRALFLPQKGLRKPRKKSFEDLFSE